MDNFKKIIKSFAMRLLKSVIFKVALLLILILAVLLPAFVYFITIDDGTFKDGDWKSTPYVASTYTGQANISGDGITTNQSAQELWDEMKKKGNNVSQYLDSPEELEKLMNAEIITQYPKIGKGDLDGIIQFERHKTDGKSEMITYIDSETFSKYVGDNNSKALDYFTIDDQGNALVAVKNTTTYELTSNDSDIDISEYTQTLSNSDKKSDGEYKRTETIITTKPINYKSMVQKYTMPFQYLWSLLVIGDNKDFVLELADLVYNSQITISIYDNVTTTVNKDEYTYHKEAKIDTYAEVQAEKNFGVTNYPQKRYWISSDSPDAAENYDEKYQSDFSKDSTDYEVVNTITYEDDIPIIELTTADVWIIKYEKEYTYQAAENISNDENANNLDNTEYVLDEDASQTSNENDLLLKDLHALELAAEAKKYIENNRKVTTSNTNTSNITLPTWPGGTSSSTNKNTSSSLDSNILETQAEDVVVNVKYVESKHYNHNIDRKQTTTNTVTAQKYIAGPTTSTIKDDPDADAPNFVNILRSSKYRNTKNVIIEVSSWLFELLETNQDTSNMVDLTKYLLYKATNQSFGVTEYDFSLYKSNSFSSIGGIYGGNIQEKVWFALKDLGYSDTVVAGAMGNIHYESGGFSASSVEGGSGEGIGLIQWSFGRKTQLINYATSKGLSWQDEDTQVEFLIAEISGQGPASEYANVRISGYIGTEKVVSTSSDWSNANNINDATLYFMRFFESPKSKDSLGQRQSLAQAYYDQYQGKTAPAKVDIKLTGENKTKMENLISEAIRISNDDAYQYSQTYRESQYYYDCSSFVSRLYTQYFGLTRLDSGSAGKGTDNIKANCKSKYKVVSMTNLEPGDILWKEGHVALYIGNNQIAEAQGTATGILIGTYRQGRFTEAYRIIQ